MILPREREATKTELPLIFAKTDAAGIETP
jgi:hypothetical protein